MFDRTQSTVAHVDPEIWAAIQAENRRQEEHIELIAVGELRLARP